MKPILIFALSERCGSTAITEAIAESTDTEWLAEPFHPDWDNWSSVKFENVKFSTSNIAEICSIYNIGVCKTISHHLDLKSNKDLINKFTTVFLYRQSFVDMILSEWVSSNYKIKYNKALYYIDHIRNEKDFHVLERDPIDIKFLIEKYNYWFLEKRRLLTKCRFDRIIKYEDYFNDNVISNHMTLLDKFNLKNVSDTFKSKIEKDKKHNSHEVYQKIIPNYEEVMKFRNELIL